MVRWLPLAELVAGCWPSAPAEGPHAIDRLDLTDRAWATPLNGEALPVETRMRALWHDRWLVQWDHQSFVFGVDDGLRASREGRLPAVTPDGAWGYGIRAAGVSLRGRWQTLRTTPTRLDPGPVRGSHAARLDPDNDVWWSEETAQRRPVTRATTGGWATRWCRENKPGVRVSPSGEHVLCATDPASWSVFSRWGWRQGTWTDSGMEPRQVSWSRAEDRLVFTGHDRVAYWEPRTGTSWQHPVPPGTAAVVTSDGSLVVASLGPAVGFFDAATGERLDDPQRPALAESPGQVEWGLPQAVPPQSPTVQCRRPVAGTIRWADRSIRPGRTQVAISGSGCHAAVVEGDQLWLVDLRARAATLLAEHLEGDDLWFDDDGELVFSRRTFDGRHGKGGPSRVLRWSPRRGLRSTLFPDFRRRGGVRLDDQGVPWVQGDGRWYALDDRGRLRAGPPGLEMPDVGSATHLHARFGSVAVLDRRGDPRCVVPAEQDLLTSSSGRYLAWRDAPTVSLTGRSAGPGLWALHVADLERCTRTRFPPSPAAGRPPSVGRPPDALRAHPRLQDRRDWLVGARSPNGRVAVVIETPRMLPAWGARRFGRPSHGQPAPAWVWHPDEEEAEIFELWTRAPVLVDDAGTVRWVHQGRILERPPGQEARVLPDLEGALALAWHPAGGWVAAGSGALHIADPH